MHINRDAHGELVSNPSAREMQGSSAHTAAPDLDAGNLSWGESHAGKRDIGDLNNRTLIDLTAAGIPIPAHLAISTWYLIYVNMGNYPNILQLTVLQLSV